MNFIFIKLMFLLYLREYINYITMKISKLSLIAVVSLTFLQCTDSEDNFNTNSQTPNSQQESIHDLNNHQSTTEDKKLSIQGGSGGPE